MDRLNKDGIRGIVVQFLLTLVSFVILFVAAGTINWINGWIYFGLACLSLIISGGILAKANPQMLNARGSVVKEGTKGFDRAWVALYPVITLVNLVVIGFDAMRFHWSFMPIWLSILGLALFIPAFLIATWAMAVNKFFEWTVRIQNDRGQYVCKDGPYRFIRHPGYSGLIISLMVFPLILGSCWGLVLSFILALVIIARTVLEDRTLQKELPGYREYASTVRYRLLPFVW
ncbi:MAG: isoprenylcysteine carboxylmethyltransferase family protein [Dehalococcoidia bacterium]|nr:isoprenylcysteine carboxylmethyltransferase family protein [Dehalococcoidia bacterium]